KMSSGESQPTSSWSMSLSDIGILISFFDIVKNAIYTDIFTLSFKLSMLGVTKRRSLISVEYIALLVGCISWLLPVTKAPNMFATPALFLCAYLISKLITKADKEKLW
ncbi:hypothetical protein M1L23_12400, partial [Aliidiomarina sp. Y6]|nr:hypothetical protein [Aliidiomarina quisquiliarum]